MESPRDGVPISAPVASTRVRPLPWLLFGLLAAVAGGLPSFSLGANLMILIVGGALFCVGLARACGAGSPAAGGSAGPEQLPRGAGWWVVPIAGLVLVETANYLLGSTYDHPTLSGLADPWLERYPVRAAAFLAWSGAFWTLVRR